MTAGANIRVIAVTVEHHREPLGVGEPTPRLSWKTAAPSGWQQDAYEIETRRGSVRWSTSWTASEESVLLPWPGDPLRSRERATVRVRVRGRDGTASGWSAPVAVEAGLLNPADWSAEAVSPAVGKLRGGDGPAALVRREFAVDRDVTRARLYVTAHGVYEMEINGNRVGDHALAPGWTSYPNRLRYQTYDVTDFIRLGANAIGAWLAAGWYCGRLGFHDGGTANLYGSQVALLAQLVIDHPDGTTTTIGTDSGWRSTLGPIEAASLLDGETYDARREVTGWSGPGLDDESWSPVSIVSRDPATLAAPTGPPVRCTEEIPPVRIHQLDDERLLLDFGQNLVGRLRLTVSGPAGHRVVMRHAELLEDGELCVRPLRGARATDCYVMRGDGPETWEPRFTIHGFRYAEITGWRGDDPMRHVVARVYHTDMVPSGSFRCSDELVNRLHANVVWSLRGNFVDIPTDCPQRDERLGWTGDIQIFAPTAAFLYDCAGMLASWLRDVAAEQLPDGTVPWYVPSIPGGPEWTPPRPGAGWGDVVALTPWDLYVAYGDLELLSAQYESARRWVDLQSRLAGPSHVWDTGFQLGDWLDPSAPPEDPAAGRTDRYLVATAYYARSTQHVAWMAAALGHAEDHGRYAERAERIREAFQHRFVRPDGRLTSDTQTAYALAITFDLLADPALRVAAGDRLAELVASGGHTIQTGFIGTPLLAPALTATGHVHTAYALLLQRQCPSWLYALEHDATTVWERWDSLRPDGTVNPGGMTSFNHYALGAIAEWLHTVVAGIAPAAPGYREIAFRPRPGGGLTWAEATHESPYGRIAIRWDLIDSGLRVRTTVPTGSRARIEWPDGAQTPLAAGTATTWHPAVAASAPDRALIVPRP